MPRGRRPKKQPPKRAAAPAETGAPAWQATAAIFLCAAFLYVYLAPMAPPKLAADGVTVGEALGPKRLLMHGESERRYFRDAAIGEAVSGLLNPGYMISSWSGPGGAISVSDRAPILLAAAATALVAWAAGDAMLLAFGVAGKLFRLERLVLALAAGLPAVSTVVLLLGLAGLLQSRLAFAVAAACAVAAGAALRRREAPGEKRPPSANDSGTADGSQKSIAWAYWVIGGQSLLVAAGAMLPPIDFDVREYHLQVPKEWYVAGGVSFMPHNVYGNMPQGAEMLSLPAMALLGDWRAGASAGKLLIALMAPLTALGLVTAGRRFFDDAAAGAYAGVLYLSAPWVLYLSVNGLVDAYWAGLGFFTAYALGRACWERAASRPSEEQASADGASWGWFALSGWFAGAATACKYPALVFILIPAIFIAGGLAQPRPGKAITAMVLAAAAACGPWFAKNAVLIGNPVYPLLQSVFPVAERSPELAENWSSAHRPPGFHPGGLYYNLADSLVLSDWASPVLLPLAAAAAIFTRRRRIAAVLWAIVGFLVLEWWVLTHRIDRFLMPTLPFLAVAAGLALSVRAGSAWRIAGGVLTGLAILLGALFVACGVMGDARFLSPLAALDRDVGDGESLGRTNPWHDFFNEHRTPGAAVLAVGEGQVYDLDPPILYSTCFDPCTFELLARDKSPEEVAAALHARNVEFLYVNWPEIDRYRSPGNYGFTDWVQPAVFDDLVAAGVLEQLPALPNRARDTAYRVVGAGMSE